MRPDCPDGSDESAGCSKCAHDQFRCNDGVCLSLSKVCDGVDDCTHSEDEESCSNVICTSGQFTCASGQCVPESAKCNGHQDCYDNSDESNCNKVDRLMDGEPSGLRSTGGAVLIKKLVFVYPFLSQEVNKLLYNMLIYEQVRLRFAVLEVYLVAAEE
nr:unnamed protein product [Callosobruchus chinensis]